MAGERIVVIDDSPTIIKMVQLILSRAGYAIEAADDGEAGLQAIRRQRPDLVLLDYMMPRLNGYQVCRELAADPELSSVPVVLMSAKGDQVGERFVKMAGVVDYVTKPFPPEALREIVLRALGTSRPGAMPQGTIDEALEPSEDADDDLRGNLRVVPLPDVLQIVEHHELSGRLQLSRGNERIELHLRRGRLEQALGHGLAEESLIGRFFLERELVTRAALDEALDDALREGRPSEPGSAAPALPLGQRLIERGGLTRADLRAALIRQSSELIYEALRWRTGQFRLRTGAELAPIAVEAGLQLAIDPLVREGCRRLDEWHVFERAFGTAQAVFARDDSAQRARTVRLSREEQLVIDQLDGQSDVAELVRSCRLGSFEVSRALYRLLSQKLIRRVE